MDQGSEEEVPIGDVRDKNIPMLWTFKVKRHPTGKVLKRKGRIVVSGNVMRPYAEGTHAPIIAWPTTRSSL